MRDATLTLIIACVTTATSLPAQATWTRRYPTQAPPYRTDAAMAFDTVRGRVRLFGGTADGSNRLSDMWEWNGNNWELVQASGAPARSGHGMAFDSVRGRMVVFGGAGSTGTNDTWELAGTQWQQRTTTQQPAARTECSMTFDGARGRVVLFGGRDGTGTAFNQTWEWDGQSWLLRTPSPAPMPRSRTRLVYDPLRAVSVLYGGVTSGGIQQQLADTWTWDGTTWRMLTPPNTPVPRVDHQMAFDEHRGRLVLHGDPYHHPFSWEWDGLTWSMVLTSTPDVQIQHAMAYDTNRRAVVMYGSNLQVYANHGDTWIYRTALPAEFVLYGQGCPGSAGVPLLANAPFSLPWIGDTFRTQVTSLGPSVVAVIFLTGVVATPATSLAAYGMPGCDSFLNVAAAQLGLATAGTAGWSIAVPNAASLAGLRLHQQALVLDAVNPAGAVVSNAGTMVVGVR